MAGIVVFDASALIALFSESDTHHAWAIEAFRQTVEYDYQISALTLAEVLVHPTKLGVEKRVMDNIQSLGMEVMPLHSESAAPVAKLRVLSGLKMPDVVVLNQALAVGASIVTADQTLASCSKSMAIEVFAPMPNTKD